MTVWMKHETLPDRLIEVPEAAVTGHELSGWRVTDPPPPPPVEDETEDDETTSGDVVGESEQPDPAGSRRSTASTKRNKE